MIVLVPSCAEMGMPSKYARIDHRPDDLLAGSGEGFHRSVRLDGGYRVIDERLDLEVRPYAIDAALPRLALTGRGGALVVLPLLVETDQSAPFGDFELAAEVFARDAHGGVLVLPGIASGHDLRQQLALERRRCCDDSARVAEIQLDHVGVARVLPVRKAPLRAPFGIVHRRRRSAAGELQLI